MLGCSHLYICKMTTAYIILAAIVIVPTLQQDSCKDERDDCERNKQWCTNENFANNYCAKTCEKCSADRECQFPFIFRGVSYSTCSNPDHAKGPWCSTQTDDMNNHVTGQFKYCKVSCEPPCDNGACTGLNTCTCEPGWEGPQCQNAVCEPQCVMGKCTAPHTCTYHPGPFDPPCDKEVIASICLDLNQDSCASTSIRNQCKSLCSAESCSSSCLNGVCTGNFTCECEEGFKGPGCDKPDATDSSVDSYDCPFPWLYVNNNFTKQCLYTPMGAYNRHPLPGHRGKHTWENARQICQDFGGDLPRFNTMNDMIGIHHFLYKDFSLASRNVLIHSTWVRAYRTSEGKNYWADDDTEVSSDLLSPRLYFNNRRDRKTKEMIPAPTTIDKECMVFIPIRGNEQAGIWNKGDIACDEPVSRTWPMQLLCQKWIVEPSQAYSDDKNTWLTKPNTQQ